MPCEHRQVRGLAILATFKNILLSVIKVLIFLRGKSGIKA